MGSSGSLAVCVLYAIRTTSLCRDAYRTDSIWPLKHLTERGHKALLAKVAVMLAGLGTCVEKLTVPPVTSQGQSVERYASSKDRGKCSHELLHTLDL